MSLSPSMVTVKGYGELEYSALPSSNEDRLSEETESLPPAGSNEAVLSHSHFPTGIVSEWATQNAKFK